MKTVYNIALALAAAFAPVAALADATLPIAAPDTVIEAQYGYVAFTQSLGKTGGIASSIQISGLAAYAIYQGMKDVSEAPGAIANTKVRNGENITCTMGLFQQAVCLVSFETLAAGKFVTGH